MDNMDTKEAPIPVTNQPPPSYTPAQTFQPPPVQSYPPPPQPYVPQQGHTTVVINSTGGNYIPVGKDPTHVRCPSCHSDVFTTVQSTATSRTHLWAMLLCLVGCWPCVCVPYCMDSCKASNHYCPVCNCYIGSFK